MLVLSRKEGESIKIFHSGIEVATVEIARVGNGRRVTVAMQGPPDVRFVRTELLEPEHDVGSPIA